MVTGQPVKDLLDLDTYSIKSLIMAHNDMQKEQERARRR